MTVFINDVRLGDRLTEIRKEIIQGVLSGQRAHHRQRLRAARNIDRDSGHGGDRRQIKLRNGGVRAILVDRRAFRRWNLAIGRTGGEEAPLIVRDNGHLGRVALRRLRQRRPSGGIGRPLCPGSHPRRANP